MNLKHTIIAVLAAAAFIPVTAQEQVKAEIRKGNAYQPETYSMMLSLPVSNRHNTYKLFRGGFLYYPFISVAVGAKPLLLCRRRRPSTRATEKKAAAKPSCTSMSPTTGARTAQS